MFGEHSRHCPHCGHHEDKMAMAHDKFEEYRRKMKKHYECADEETRKKFFIGAVLAFLALVFSIKIGRAMKRK